MDARTIAAGVACTALIIFMSLAPQETAGVPLTGLLNGWLSHFAAYAVYAPIVLLNFIQPMKRRSLLAALIIAISLGTITELLQPYSGRTADIMDWGFNSAGALAGLGAATLLSTRNKTISKGM